MPHEYAPRPLVGVGTGGGGMQGGRLPPPTHTHTDLRIRVRIIGFVPTHFQMRTRYFNCPNVVSLSMTGYLVKGLKTQRFVSSAPRAYMMGRNYTDSMFPINFARSYVRQKNNF